MIFEWDDDKRRATITKHKIDFIDAVTIFLGRYTLQAARSDAEQRQMAIGELDGKLIAVIFTMREGNYRIVTVRRAREHERKQHQALLAGRNPGDEGRN